MAKFKARICKRCRGDGAVHKEGDDDKLCSWCPLPRPSVVRKWFPGKSCVIDKGTVYETEGILAKIPFLSQYKEWFVVVITVDEAMSPKDYEYYQKQFHVRILMERITLS